MSGFDEQLDFVVVGSGSMCAVLQMRAEGKRVRILDKEKLVGGTTARSGGVMWTPNNPSGKRWVSAGAALQARAARRWIGDRRSVCDRRIGRIGDGVLLSGCRP